jgi:hypothetical protein
MKKLILPIVLVVAAGLGTTRGHAESNSEKVFTSQLTKKCRSGACIMDCTSKGQGCLSDCGVDGSCVTSCNDQKKSCMFDCVKNCDYY